MANVDASAPAVNNPDDLMEVAQAFFGWPWFGAGEDEASKKAAAGPNGACAPLLARSRAWAVHVRVGMLCVSASPALVAAARSRR
jgi:hypothetical protein